MHVYKNGIHYFDDEEEQNCNCNTKSKHIHDDDAMTMYLYIYIRYNNMKCSSKIGQTAQNPHVDN